jgi:hypothetical protein
MKHFTISETELDSLGRHLRDIDDAAESIKKKTGAAKVDCEDIDHAVDAVSAVLQAVSQRLQN